jgi:hypothetical protein
MESANPSAGNSAELSIADSIVRTSEDLPFAIPPMIALGDSTVTTPTIAPSSVSCSRSGLIWDELRFGQMYRCLAPDPLLWTMLVHDKAFWESWSWDG